MKFLCLAYGNEAEWNKLTKIKQVELLANDKVIIDRGNLVSIVSEPTTVQSPQHILKTKSGPYNEFNNKLAGFSIIEAKDLKEAIELVANTPCSYAGGATEIWQMKEQ